MAGASLVSGLCWVAWPERVPDFEGRPLSVWLDELSKVRTAEQSEKIKTAVKSLGPAAVPFLVNRLHYRDSVWKKRYRDFYSSRIGRWPGWMISRLPAPSSVNADWIRMNAVVALGWLEMAALPAAPDIAAALSDESQSVRFFAAQLLKTLGPSAHETLPVLLFSLQSTNASLADNVIGVVVSVGQDQPETVRSLVVLLAGPDEVKVRVLETLSRLGRSARAAEPGINSLLASTNSNVKTGAACALWEIVPARHVELFQEIEEIAKSNDKKLHLLAGLKLVQMQPLTPPAGELLARLIREGNDSFRWSAFAALRKRGTDASNAVPALIAGLEAENPRVVAKAAEVLGDVAGPEQSTLRSLEKAQQHEHLMVRDAAREALTKLQSRVER